MSENNSFKKFSLVAVGRIIAAGLYSGFYLIFATILGPESFGQMSFILAIAGTASVISRFGLPVSAIVYNSKQDQTMSNQINMLAIITTGSASLILLSIDVYASLLCFALSTFLMNTSNLIGLKKYKKFFWTSVIRGILIITIPILLFFILDIPGIVLGLAIANFIGSISFFKSLKIKINSFRDLRNNRQVLIHNYGASISTSLSRWIDKLLIVPLFGFTNVGIYQLNLQILFVLTILPSSLHSFLLSEKVSGNKHGRIRYVAILIAVVLVLLVIIVGPLAINSLFTKYSEGIFALQIVIISLIPLTITEIIKADLQAKESTKVGYLAIVKIGSLLVLLALLGNLYGLVGLSFGFLSSAIIETLFIVFLFRK